MNDPNNIPDTFRRAATPPPARKHLPAMHSHVDRPQPAPAPAQPALPRATHDNPPPRFPMPVVAEPPATATVHLIQRFMASWTETLTNTGLIKLADEFTGLSEEEARALNQAVGRIKPDYRPMLTNMGQDVRPYRLWTQHRETYEPHPAMSRALVKMKSDTEIPGEVFQRLRHPNPLFLLPGAPPIQHADGHPGRIIAIFVTGAVSKRYRAHGASLADDAPSNASALTDTHDPNCNAYHATVVSEVHSLDGSQIIDLDWCHLTVPIRENFSLDELVFQTASDGFQWSADMRASAEELTGNSMFQYLEHAARAVVSHLLYACSRTTEMDDKPRASHPPAKPEKGKPTPQPSAQIRRMGWRTGAAIADSIRRAATGQPGPGTGKKRTPHMRGAHLHLYRVGPGRREIDLKWLDPIPVNAALDDGATITRHPMR